jgi:hypothetical protein
MPWILLGVGALAIIAVIGAMLASRRQSDVNVNVSQAATATAAAVAVPVTVVVTTTPAPATPTTIPTVAPTASPPPPPTEVPIIAPTAPPPVTVVAVTQVVEAAPPPAAPPPAPPTAPPPPPPTAVSAKPTVAAPATAAAPAKPAAPAADTFTGQVSGAGGLGNTRADADAAYGAPAGETPAKQVVYRRPPVEIHVLYSADPARVEAVARITPRDGAISLEAAQAAAKALLPRDVERRGGAAEGNDAFVVERWKSATLGRALPESAFREMGGAAGDLLVMYIKNPAGAVERTIVGIGDSPEQLRARMGT